MVKTIQAVKGMNDVLPEEMKYWHAIENKLRELSHSYAYQEIRTPILEKTDLFQRSVGETTDIVTKEMYTFEDRDGTSVTMRPEGTASVVRAGLERGLFYNQIQKLWYLGPIFRHERPQRGRYRQFYQFGLEAVGISGVEIEIEQLLFIRDLWRALNIENKIRLEINCLGDAEARKNYRVALCDYFSKHIDELDEESKQRLKQNPLRILDSKNPELQDLIEAAPKLIDYLGEHSKNNFLKLQTLLKVLGFDFVINKRLVRGLDYYSETVYEWVTEELGAQGTVAAGGRYDVLIEQLGGQPTPAVGFAMGIERIIELYKMTDLAKKLSDHPDIYCVFVGEAAVQIGLEIATEIRHKMTKLSVLCNLQGGSFKNQIKKADKSGAKIALILGEDELSQQMITLKYLREHKEQTQIPQTDIIKHLQQIQWGV